MPEWSGKWKGGRFYRDERGKPVFFIERRGRVVKLQTHDEELAVGELARFLQDPVAFCRPPPAPEGPEAPVYITKERVILYLESIHKAVDDHRDARLSQLEDWAAIDPPLDLKNSDRKILRTALASFDGGHRGRTETLNAFARFLVKEGELRSWNPLVNTRTPKETRAERVAYSLEELRAKFRELTSQAVRDVMLVRVASGLHHTEIEQLEKCRIYEGPLPDKGVGIRTLDDTHEIRGVLQVRQKTKPRHRVSVGADVLAAALRLRERVPGRGYVWKALDPLVPSNLRHTFVTLCGELGETVAYKAAGVTLDQIQQIVGHRIGSKVTLSSYDKLQVPPMVRLPLEFP